MSDYEKPPNHFEITAIISICALLFIAALRDLGHLSWAVPAMTLFSLGGLGFLKSLPARCPNLKGLAHSLSPQAMRAEVNRPTLGSALSKCPVVAPQQR